MKTLDIQKDFFQTALGAKQESNRYLKVYQELVFIRYFEVIKNSLPNFSQTNSNLEELVKEFIKCGSKEMLVWRIPYEFFKFVKQNRLVCKKEQELIKYELAQLSLYVKNCKIKTKKFNWRKNYKLSKSVKLFKSNFDLLNRGEKSYILIFKAKDDYKIYSLEITKIIYSLLKIMQNSNFSANRALKIVCNLNNINFKDSKKLLTPTLENFAKVGIF